MQTEEYAKMRQQEDRYWWFVARRALALELLAPGLSPSNTILDVGCGTGALLEELQRRYKAGGVDFSRHALAFSASRNLCVLSLGDAQRLPYQSSTFDSVVSLDTIEHVPDDLAATKEIARVLKPGGCFVMNVPAYAWLWGPHDVALMHQRRYTATSVRELMLASGLHVERINYSVFFLFPVVVLMRVVERFQRGPAKVRLPKVGNGFNRALVSLMAFEARLAAKVRLPWGSSVVAIVRKPL